MKQITRYKRSALAAGMIICCGFLLTQCINRENDKTAVAKKVNFKQFAGSVTCANCHKDIYNTHIKTAHYRTSQPASATTIKGSFEPGKNSFSYDMASMIEMEKRDGKFYQVAYTNGIEKEAHPFDIVIGSGTKGQTSLYWNNNQLFQLPISYFTAAGQWSNSPGYRQRASFDRPISARCMECHSTYIHSVSADGIQPEEYDRASLLYGIDCERCHGPGAEHAAFQLQHPDEPKGKYIINPVSLSRQQQLDACALCHNGRSKNIKPSFEFVAGDSLPAFFVQDTARPNPDNVDVHGNQYGLLRASKCFRMSETMTCNTCHNPHQNERDKVEVFSQRCLGCHNTSEHGNGKICKMTASLGNAITANCIDCHMPAKPSKAIVVFLPGATAPVSAYVRSHFISIYPDETKKFMDEKKAVSQ
jgi:hypothetical protein